MSQDNNEISVPGKVLFYGGYSVMVLGHISLSLAVFSDKGKGVNATWKLGEKRLISPQFDLDIEPNLEHAGKEDALLVEYAYLTGEHYLKTHGIWKDTSITLINDEIFGTKPDEKSGLGSSAAATVAVIKALFLANGIDPEVHKETVLKLSQFANSWFFDKVASAFDITTSSMGQSIIYKRYDPNMIVLPTDNTKEELVEKILLTVNKPWTYIEARPVNLSEQLLLFNIEGASTSTMSAVKAWKKWMVNSREEFNALMEKQHEVESKAIEALLSKDYENVRRWTHEARAIHREMQDQISKIVSAFDPVEPEPLTSIINTVEQRVGGIIAGRCPGAGGWDSVAFLAQPNVSVDIGQIIDIGNQYGLTLKPINIKLV